MRPVVVIVGPTAGGKTRLAIDMASRLPGGGECICADSMQVYRGMDIGTAKPTASEQAEAPHHLIDIADPADDGFTVDVWLAACEEAIADIRRRDHWPILVGGTNLYVQAFYYGLFEGPERDPAIRERLAASSLEALRSRLDEVDPEAAARIHPNDRRRTIRALEVHEQTGRPMSAWQREWTSTPREDAVLVGLDYPAEAINRRINARVRAMVDAGLVDEVQGLQEAGVLGAQASEALGYKQILEYLRGECGLDDAIEQVKIRTRRFAKQQRTWLRRFRALPTSTWLEGESKSSQSLAEQAISFVLERGSTEP